MQYIHQLPKWPDLYWDQAKLALPLADMRHCQGLLLGRMSALGFDSRAEASLQVLTTNIIKSSEIEGEYLDSMQVRSSVARRLGLDIGGLAPIDRHVEGIVDMMLDATQQYHSPLTDERLFGWHGALFPTSRSGLCLIMAGMWRLPEADPMQVVSGPMGRERIHFEAPTADRLADEMLAFLDWFNHVESIDPVLKAAVAHFWFVTIHPFEDGNGRIARAIADMCLAQADNMSDRFYSMSCQIEKERKDYYLMLERSQKGGLDITAWLEWFLGCLGRAIENAGQTLNTVLRKVQIFEKLNHRNINERQLKVLNRLFNGFEGKLTTAKYSKLTKCSHDTALRDIQKLIEYSVIKKSSASGRNTSYEIDLSV